MLDATQCPVHGHVASTGQATALKEPRSPISRSATKEREGSRQRGEELPGSGLGSEARRPAVSLPER